MMTSLFDPLDRPGFIPLRNRTVMSAMSRGFADADHCPTPAMVDLYDPGLVKIALNGSFC